MLFAYVAAHLVNHALGLEFFIATAERGLAVAVAVWQSVPGTFLLYGAAATHISLALLAVYEHRTLRMPPREILRIALGLGMPVLLIGHAVSTRLAFEMYGHPPDYAHTVWSLWNLGRQGLQLALLVPGWLHGCLGLNFAFGRRPWFRRARLPLFGAALLVPTLAVLGFLSMVKEVSLRARDPAWIDETIGRIDEAQRAALTRSATTRSSSGSRSSRACCSRAWCGARSRSGAARSSRSAIPAAPCACRAAGPSRSEPQPRIAHVSMCGGQARCSTCRVRVLTGKDRCPPAEAAERETLARIGAAADTRLGCQLRPSGDVSVVPLLHARRRARHRAAARAPRSASSRSSSSTSAASGRADACCPTTCSTRSTASARRSRDRASAGGTTIQFTGDRGVVVFGTDVVASEARRRRSPPRPRSTGGLSLLHVELQRTLGCASSHVAVVHAGATAIGAIGDRARRTLAAAGATIEAMRQVAAALEREAATGVFVTREALVDASADLAVADWREVVSSGDVRIDIGRVGAPSPAIAD